MESKAFDRSKNTAAVFFLIFIASYFFSQINERICCRKPFSENELCFRKQGILMYLFIILLMLVLTELFDSLEDHHGLLF